MKIEVKKPTQEELQKLGVKNWSIWTCQPSEFDWYYSENETCYFIEGKVTVEFNGQSVTIQKGDLVTFPAGLSCRWKVHEAVKKHYRFG